MGFFRVLIPFSLPLIHFLFDEKLKFVSKFSNVSEIRCWMLKSTNIHLGFIGSYSGNVANFYELIIINEFYFCHKLSTPPKSDELFRFEN